MKSEQVKLSEMLPLIYSYISKVVKASVSEALQELHALKEKENDLTTDYLSVEQAAYFLSVSKNTIYYLVKNSQVPYSRLGQRKLMFSKKDLIQLFESRKLKNTNQSKNESNKCKLQNSLI